MATLGIRKTTYDGLSAVRKAILNLVVDRLDLGTPAVYQNPVGGAFWYLYDDDRIDLRDLAVFGKVAANLASLNLSLTDSNGDRKSRATLRQELLAWVQSLSVVWPSEIDYTGQTNPWQYTLTQNGAPAAIRAGDGVPSGWVPTSL